MQEKDKEEWLVLVENPDVKNNLQRGKFNFLPKEHNLFDQRGLQILLQFLPAYRL